MIFNLAKLKSENIILTNEDEKFVGTELELQPFMIEVKRLSRSEKIDVATKALGDEGAISGGKYSEVMFKEAIVNVEGFTDENQQPISLEAGVVGLIWEYAPDTMVNAIKDAIQSFDISEEKKSDQQEQDSLDTPNGSF